MVAFASNRASKHLLTHPRQAAKQICQNRECRARLWPISQRRQATKASTTAGTGEYHCWYKQVPLLVLAWYAGVPPADGCGKWMRMAGCGKPQARRLRTTTLQPEPIGIQAFLAKFGKNEPLCHPPHQNEPPDKSFKKKELQAPVAHLFIFSRKSSTRARA